MKADNEVNSEVNYKTQIVKALKDNPWSAHYLTAYEIFKSSIFLAKVLNLLELSVKNIQILTLHIPTLGALRILIIFLWKSFQRRV